MSDKYDNMIRDALTKAQAKYGLGGNEECLAIVKAIIEQESDFNPKKVNPTSSATGLMQVTKAAAQQMGFDHALMKDARTNIECGVLYLAYNMSLFDGDCWKGIAAYYTGPGRLKKAGGDLAKLPETGAGNRTKTQDYVDAVRRRTAKFKSDSKKDASPSANDDLERLRRKTELLERWLKLDFKAEGQRKKLDQLIQKLLDEIERELDALGKETKGG